MHHFAPTSLAGHRGQNHLHLDLHLGQPAQAIAACNDGLTEHQPRHDQRGTQRGLAHAHAHIDAGDPQATLSHPLATLNTLPTKTSTGQRAMLWPPIRGVQGASLRGQGRPSGPAVAGRVWAHASNL